MNQYTTNNVTNITWYNEQDNKIENIFLTILDKDWLDSDGGPHYSNAYNLFPRVYQLLKEDSEMFTIAFLLQHFRVKINKLNQNFEKDSFIAGRLIKEFDLNFKNNPENHNKLRVLVDYYTPKPRSETTREYPYPTCPTYGSGIANHPHYYESDSANLKWNRQKQDYDYVKEYKDLCDLLSKPIKK